MVRVDQAAKGRQGFANISNIEVAGLFEPRRKQVLVGDEVTQVGLEVANGFRVFFSHRTEVFVCEALGGGEGQQLVGEVLVEDEAKDVVLVFVSLDLGSHLVGRFPNLGCELLLIHGEYF
ncbi:hypothetical protein D3C80_1381690 [compost metagenome]